MRPALWRWTKRILVGSTLILLAFVAVIFVNHTARSAIESRGYPAPGQIVDAGGHRLHFLSQGDGGPVVVLEAPIGGSCLGWSLVQPEISRSTRVISYDRAGYGWSEAGPVPRTAAQLVSELHTALERANVKGPYLLVGSSFGGLTHRLFAARYPDDVAGMVLVDATHEGFLDRVPPMEAEIESETKGIYVARMLAHLGVLRLLDMPIGEGSSGKLPVGLKPAARAVGFRAGWANAIYQEMHAIKQSLVEVKFAVSGVSGPLLGDKPLVVLVRGKSDESDPEREKVSLALQEDLSKSSTRGRMRVVQKSGHFIQADQPAAVIQAIQEVLEECRKRK